jgi:phage gpG-like protein
MDFKDVVKNIVDDVAVDLTQEFDRNFERKAFFNKKWPETKHTYSRGSLLDRSGKLRRSINKTNTGHSISWKSSLPYASIHNEGGEIEVTAKMKSYFWAMFYKANGAAKGNKGGKKRIEKLSGEAAKWKAMALMKVGTIMKIDQRQFIGWDPQVDRRVQLIVNHNMEEVGKTIKKNLKQ